MNPQAEALAELFAVTAAHTASGRIDHCWCDFCIVCSTAHQTVAVCDCLTRYVLRPCARSCAALVSGCAIMLPALILAAAVYVPPPSPVLINVCSFCADVTHLLQKTGH